MNLDQARDFAELLKKGLIFYSGNEPQARYYYRESQYYIDMNIEAGTGLPFFVKYFWIDFIKFLKDKDLSGSKEFLEQNIQFIDKPHRLAVNRKQAVQIADLLKRGIQFQSGSPYQQNFYFENGKYHEYNVNLHTTMVLDHITRYREDFILFLSRKPVELFRDYLKKNSALLETESELEKAIAPYAGEYRIKDKQWQKKFPRLEIEIDKQSLLLRNHIESTHELTGFKTDPVRFNFKGEINLDMVDIEITFRNPDEAEFCWIDTVTYPMVFEIVRKKSGT